MAETPGTDDQPIAVVEGGTLTIRGDFQMRLPLFHHLMIAPAAQVRVSRETLERPPEPMEVDLQDRIRRMESSAGRYPTPRELARMRVRMAQKEARMRLIKALRAQNRGLMSNSDCSGSSDPGFTGPQERPPHQRP